MLKTFNALINQGLTIGIIQGNYSVVISKSYFKLDELIAAPLLGPDPILGKKEENSRDQD